LSLDETEITSTQRSNLVFDILKIDPYLRREI